jgi:hypothetical protein
MVVVVVVVAAAAGVVVVELSWKLLLLCGLGMLGGGI